jgi:hypothetical protein
MSLLVLYVLLLMLSPTEIKDHRQAHKGANDNILTQIVSPGNAWQMKKVLQISET